MLKVNSVSNSTQITETGIFTVIYDKTGVGVTIAKIQLKDTDLPYTPPSIVNPSQYVIIDHNEGE